jgi:hypothetical protein
MRQVKSGGMMPPLFCCPLVSPVERSVPGAARPHHQSEAELVLLAGKIDWDWIDGETHRSTAKSDGQNVISKLTFQPGRSVGLIKQYCV